MAASANFETLAKMLAERVGAPNEFAAVAMACERLLAETRQVRPPIRLKALLERLAVNYQYDVSPIGTEEASLSFVDGRLSLVIPRERFKSSPKRARFSIAHEIGHLILFRTIGQHALSLGENDPDAYRAVELLCDFAASHLLMPRDQLAAAVRVRGVGRGGVRNLANLFEVSQEALFRGIADLVPDGTVTMWRRYRRHSQEELTWRLWGSYAPTSGIGNRPWLPKGCTLKHLTIGRQLDDLTPDKAIVVRDVDLRLNKTNTRHDAVVCRWSPQPPRQQVMPAMTAPLGNTRRFVAPSDCLVAVLGRKDRIDPKLLMAED